MIIGNKVKLCALNESDSSKILEWINNPELKKMIGTVFPISNLEHKIWFEKKITNNNYERIFGIKEFRGESLIGIIGLKNIDYVNSNAELYIYLGEEESKGRGLGKDAITTLIKFAFEEMNLHRLYLEVFSYNLPAQSSYKKSGFKVEGILKESLYREGKYHDKVIMGIIKNSLSGVSKL